MSNFSQITYLLLIGYVAVALNLTLGACLRNSTGINLDLIPLLLVYIALTLDTPFILLISAFWGVFFDSVSANPVGLSSIAYTIGGMIIAGYRNVVLRKSWQIQYLSGFLCSVLVVLITYFILKFLGYEPLMTFKVFVNILISGFLNAFLTPFVFELIDWIENTFNYKPLKMSSFRPDREIKRGR